MIRLKRDAFVLLTTTTALALVSPAAAQTTPAATEGASQDDATTVPPPDIIVRGIRGSLSRAADAKRDSSQIKDVIDAEDIGKLPDTNVAEALQRVTGVQINRDLGEGSEIAVRGFSQNRVEINGQTQVGSGASGGPSFNTIPSESFSSIEVIKTPAADEIEGSLGGIVRLNTRKPLDSKRLILSGSFQDQYAERADKWAQNVSLFASNAWQTGIGDIGLLVGMTRNRRRLRQDIFDVRGWEAVNGFNRDLDGDGVVGEAIERSPTGIITNLQDGAYVPGQTRLQIKEQNRKLDSYNFATQWRPSRDLEFYALGTYNRNRSDDLQYQASSQFNSALEPDPAAVTRGGGNRVRTVYQQPNAATISADRTVLSAILGQLRPTGTPIAQRGVNFNISGDSNPQDQDVFTGQAGVKWNITDRLKVDAQYAIGRGKQVNNYINTTSGIGNLNTDAPFYFFDFGADADIPTVVPLNRTTNGLGTTQFTEASRLDLATLANYSLATAAFTIQTERNLEDAFRIDFDHEVGLGPITSLEYGGRFAQNRGYRFRDRVRDTNTSALDGTLGGLTYVQLEAQNPGITTTQPYADVLAGATGDFPRSWRSLNPQYLRDNLAALLTKYGIRYAADPGWGFDVTQKTYAAYAKANLKFDLGGVGVSGNVGVRWVRTKLDANGGVPSGTQGAPTLTQVNVQRSYDNFLPSLNLVAKPGSGIYVRFGAAQSMARPTIIQTSPFIAVSDSFDTATGGNPYLDPQRVRQFDLSVEKYWGRSNFVSLALFHKRFQERIEQGISYSCLPIGAGELESTPGNDGCLAGQDRIAAQVPVNVGAATVKGFEAAWQQSLSFLPSPLNGLGFIANYTFVDADGGSQSASGEILPVQDLSRHSYNLIGYFEKWGFQSRVAYNWRSDFYDDRTTTNQASFAKAYGQLDASINYDVTKNMTVGFEALNLLNSPERRYQEIEERFLSYRVNDTRYLFSVRIRS